MLGSRPRPNAISLPNIRFAARTSQSYMNISPPFPSPVDIQHHLYRSFLDASTADVALRVRGTWQAVYKLHRVILTQSGFFHSLFTGGFNESSPRYSVHHHGPDEIDIVFDDTNITRAAFEVCISRLYGGGPPLHLSSSLIPTSLHPLTPSFPRPPSPTPIPAGHHPATPRFLLSLLATAVYLSIPSIASQALSMILGSISPWTVLLYWKFATGRGIDWGDEWGGGEDEERGGAVGLEHIAEILLETRRETHKELVAVDAEVHTEEHLTTDLGGLDIRKEAPLEEVALSSPSSLSFSSCEELGKRDRKDPSFHYGSISDKIGESCVCWLARWGVDMFTQEVKKKVTSGKDDIDLSGSLMAVGKTTPRTTARPSTTPIPEYRYMSTHPDDGKRDYAFPGIWGRNGLDAKWVAALVSADTFFVKGERERYEFAKGVIELRRSQGEIHDSAEEIWKTLFERGIYYANMTMDDIVYISEDMSPMTGRTYVPLDVLQASHWMHSVLRHRITVRPSTLQSTSPTLTGSPTSPQIQREKDLGITLTTAEIVARRQQHPDAEDKVYYPVLGDSSMRVGDSGGLGEIPAGRGTLGCTNISMEQLFSIASGEPSTLVPVSHSSDNHASGSATLLRQSTSESAFFGLHTPLAILLSQQQDISVPMPVPASQISVVDPTRKLRWSPYPPFRFSVEFWDIDLLKEKCRLHSQTIWYAGSLFNVYVQVVRKKPSNGTSVAAIGASGSTMQVGIYLHRQSSVEAVPGSSRPAMLLERRDIRHDRGPSLPTSVAASPTGTSSYSTSIHPSSRSSTPVSTSLGTSSAPPTPILTSSSPPLPYNYSALVEPSGLHLTSFTLPATSPPQAPTQPYRDPRAAIKAFFMISCAGGTGSAQTRFSSAPDEFAVSQSWGWKSSSLTLWVNDGDLKQIPGEKSKEVSLRATVVLGLV